MTFHYWFSIAILILSSVAAFLIVYRIKKKKATYFKAPFTTRPRPPGYSLQTRTNDLFLDMFQWFFFITLSGLLPFFARQDVFLSWTLSVISILGIVYCIKKISEVFKSFERHNLGLKGEQLVGMTLDRLSSNEIKVFHDYPVQEKGKKPWNIDHIVVAPSGVFAVETKTRSKKHYHDDKKGHRVIYENGTLKFPSFEDKHGLDQAQRQANSLSDALTDTLVTAIEVNPILVLPGWYVDRKSKDGIPVVNEKLIAGVLKGPEKIDKKTRDQICRQLERVCVVE